jgi:putative tricarboxylic transport membrane protein
LSSSPQEEGQRNGAFSGRVTASILLAFAALLAIATSQIEYAFSSDPLGPQAFPFILSLALSLSGIWYLLSPGSSDPWPKGEALRSAISLIAVTTLAMAMMDHVGFLPAAFLVCGWAAYLFGASAGGAILIGTAQALFWFAIFKFGLGTYLPAGTLLFPG